MDDKQLGRYSLIRELGRGGMGIVYLATDDSLGRQVAIKTLPDKVAKDRERLARLEREAKTLASVSHPSVATIFALDESDDGRKFLVLEYVDGQSLGERLADGPMPLKETLEYAKQMAEALEAAHAQGVVHRDFKPNNVMITSGDRVKVLDFGLAKSHLMGPEMMTPEAPTLTSFNTQPGVVLGTPGFMSPEQSRGHELDHRTDIFSFGCVLFACLTGSGPFGGKTASDMMAEMLTSEPAWSRLPEGTPTGILELLIKMLAKGREHRIGNMSAVLESINELHAQVFSGSSASVTLLTSPSNLPVSVTSFIGRKRELDELRTLWQNARLLTLSGSGGCGKTRLGLRFVEELLPAVRDGACYVDLGSLPSGDLVQQAILTGIGLKEEPNKSALSTVVEHLRSKEMILLLDNCEHLVDDCAAVIDELMHQCPDIKIMVTSRQSLGNAGEHVYHVPSLGVPSEIAEADAESALQAESVRLFVDRAVTASPRFKFSNDNASTVAQICKQVDGIPLAIELAAARVRSMPVGQVARRLDDSFRLLRGGSKTALERHQTLQATIDWSFGLLTEEEQVLFRRVAVFSSGWTLEAAESVGSGDAIDELDVIDYLSQLVEKSLVTYEESDGAARYRLLGTMRQYALDKLLETPEAAHTRDRHLDFYIQMVEEAEPEIRGSAKLVKHLAMEMDNILGAIDWAMSSADGVVPALRLVAATWRFWEIRGLYLTGSSLLQDAVARADETTDPTILRRALYGCGAISLRHGAYETAESAFKRCCKICEAADDLEGLGLGNNGLGILSMNNGDLEEAKTYFEAALRSFRATNDPAGSAMALGNLGELHLMLGDFETARPLMEESVDLARKHRTFAAYMMPDHLRVVARICIKTNRLPEAVKHLQECFELIKEFQSRLDTAYTLETISDLALATSVSETAETNRSALEFAAFGEGAADGIRCRIGSPLPPSETEDRKSNIEKIRGFLGDSEFQSRYDDGRSLSMPKVIESVIVFLGSLELQSPAIETKKITTGGSARAASDS